MIGSSGKSSPGGLAGYAGIIAKALLPLNSRDDFKKQCSGMSRRFILDSPHWSYAALIIVDRGTLSVQGFPKDVYGYKQAIEKSDGYLQMSTYDYLAFVGKHMSPAALLKKWFVGQTKVLRPFSLLRLLRI